MGGNAPGEANPPEELSETVTFHRGEAPGDFPHVRCAPGVHPDDGRMKRFSCLAHSDGSGPVCTTRNGDNLLLGLRDFAQHPMHQTGDDGPPVPGVLLRSPTGKEVGRRGIGLPHMGDDPALGRHQGHFTRGGAQVDGQDKWRGRGTHGRAPLGGIGDIVLEVGSGVEGLGWECCLGFWGVGGWLHAVFCSNTIPERILPSEVEYNGDDFPL